MHVELCFFSPLKNINNPQKVWKKNIPKCYTKGIFSLLTAALPSRKLCRKEFHVHKKFISTKATRRFRLLRASEPFQAILRLLPMFFQLRQFPFQEVAYFLRLAMSFVFLSPSKWDPFIISLNFCALLQCRKYKKCREYYCSSICTRYTSPICSSEANILYNLSEKNLYKSHFLPFLLLAAEVISPSKCLHCADDMQQVKHFL